MTKEPKWTKGLITVSYNAYGVIILRDAKNNPILRTELPCSSSKMKTLEDRLNGEGFDEFDEDQTLRKSNASRLNKEKYANCHLWAAGPELYEALSVMVSMFDYSNPKEHRAFENAKAALSKALGET